MISSPLKQRTPINDFDMIPNDDISKFDHPRVTNFSLQREKAIKLEEEIYTGVGFKVYEDLHIFDVPIEFRGKQEFVHTSRCGDENDDVLILVHGYGGNGIAFVKMLKDLSKRFKVYCVDLLGLGLSSRPKFEDDNAEASIDYFLDGFEGWRKALNIEKFVLGGHSMGAYLSGLYTARVPTRVEKLYMFSPPGMTEDKDKRPHEEKINDLGFFRRQFAKLGVNFFNKKQIHTEFKQNYPRLFNWWLSGYVKYRLKIKGKDGDLIKDFF